jgi:hypothetical protein
MIAVHRCRVGGGAGATTRDVTEVVILSQYGVAPEKITGKMQRGGTVYLLSEAQYAELRRRA